MLPIHSTLRLRSNLEVDTGDDESEHDLSAAVAKASEYLKEVGGFASNFDEKEFLQDTNLQHAILGLLFGEMLHLAPLSTPRSALDFCCGTSRWSIEFAQAYPGCDVMGTDISDRLQPATTPANYKFQIQDAEKPWQLDTTYDYIHGRALVACFADNRTVIKNAFPHLKSGGYLEIQDGIVPWRGDDDSFRGSNFDKWQNLLCEGLSQTGRDLMDAKNWGRYMREEGFKDVVEQHFFMPINPWAKGQREKLIGLLCQRDWALALPDMSVPVFTKILGWTKEQYDKLMEGLLRDLENTDIHGYMEVYVAYGRKP
ncbi:hypothetical protein JX266_011782 [Neoarthrinium moseri]|nr:hypothetical protein JX266_011782 [Neoarthrinium moseri]